MSSRAAAIAYVRSLTTSDSSPEHVRDICRLAVIRFRPCTTRGELLSPDQLKAEVVPSALYGMGEVVRVDENGAEHVEGCECEECCARGRMVARGMSGWKLGSSI